MPAPRLVAHRRRTTAASHVEAADECCLIEAARRALQTPAARVDRVGYIEDRQALDRVVRQYQQLCRAAATRWGRGALREDAEAAANEGLLHAIRSWRPEGGSRFLSWAVWSVRAAVQRLRQEMAEHRERGNNISLVVNEALRLGRHCGYADLATLARDEALLRRAVGTVHTPPAGPPVLQAATTAQRVAGLRAALLARLPKGRLDAAPRGGDGEPAAAWSRWLADAAPLARLDAADEEAARGRLLRKTLSRCTPRERVVLEGHLLHGETLAQVGQRLGITRQRAQQIEATALRRLRAEAAQIAADAFAGGLAEAALALPA